jgi:hypothetical protein
MGSLRNPVFHSVLFAGLSAYGFNDIMATEENVKWKNRDIQLMFCVLFHLAR